MTPGASGRPVPDPVVEVGTLISGRYRVLGLIGEGGMARVYQVEHAELGRHFALKLLRSHLSHESAQVERFQNEARAVARLECAQIVGMVDCGFTDNGTPFFVMDLLRGSDLRELVRRDGPLSAARAIQLALDVCRGLAVAHAAGIAHRDLKPENLFVTRDAEGGERCKLLDFGVAKLTEGNATQPGALVGTPRYMAPEQLRSDQPVGPATDLFALGVTLFECLAARPPFDADTLERLLFKIMNEPAPDLLALRPDLPPALTLLVARLLSKEPRGRPASALSLAEELTRLLPQGQSRAVAGTTPKTSTTVAGPPRTTEHRAHHPVRRSRLLPGLALGTLAVSAVAALLWSKSQQASPSASLSSTARVVASLPAAPTATAPTATAPTATASTTTAPTALASARPTPSVPKGRAKPVAPAASPDLPLFYPRRKSANP